MTPAQACGMLFLISQVVKDTTKKEALRLVWTKKEIKEVSGILRVFYCLILNCLNVVLC